MVVSVPSPATAPKLGYLFRMHYALRNSTPKTPRGNPRIRADAGTTKKGALAVRIGGEGCPTLRVPARDQPPGATWKFIRSVEIPSYFTTQPRSRL
jgi:hypothetical protein